ncbi:hypothetical protein CGRA01v4_13948 [Colletotrichum graminicola]|nr:hypothetical protein CGRA01v4_13948 [Colletotrichum graminicola]
MGLARQLDRLRPCPAHVHGHQGLAAPPVPGAPRPQARRLGGAAGAAVPPPVRRRDDAGTGPVRVRPVRRSVHGGVPELRHRPAGHGEKRGAAP